MKAPLCSSRIQSPCRYLAVSIRVDAHNVRSLALASPMVGDGVRFKQGSFYRTPAMEACHGQTPSGLVLTGAILFLLVVGIGCDAPVAHRFVVEGDVMIGAIFSMHKASLSWFFYSHAWICIQLFSMCVSYTASDGLTFILEMKRHSFPKIRHRFTSIGLLC